MNILQNFKFLPWTKVFFGQYLLGQYSSWTAVPRTNVATPGLSCAKFSGYPLLALNIIEYF